MMSKIFPIPEDIRIKTRIINNMKEYVRSIPQAVNELKTLVEQQSFGKQDDPTEEMETITRYADAMSRVRFDDDDQHIQFECAEDVELFKDLQPLKKTVADFTFKVLGHFGRLLNNSLEQSEEYDNEIRSLRHDMKNKANIVDSFALFSRIVNPMCERIHWSGNLIDTIGAGYAGNPSLREDDSQERRI